MGSSPTTNKAATWATVLRFDVARPAGVTSAVLRLQVSSLSAPLAEDMPMLLLGVASGAWAHGDVTWAALSRAGGPLLPHPPQGADAAWLFDSVAKNPVNWGHAGLAVAGHVTLPAGMSTAGAAGAVRQVDVTPFVRASTGPVSFILLRHFRNNQEAGASSTAPADTLNGGAAACFHGLASRNAAARPQLLLQRG